MYSNIQLYGEHPNNTKVIFTDEGYLVIECNGISKLANLTLQGDTGVSTVYFEKGKLLVENCNITSSKSNALWLINKAQAVIKNSFISGYQRGLSVAGKSVAKAVNCQFTNTNNDRGAYVEDSVLFAENCQFSSVKSNSACVQLNGSGFFNNCNFKSRAAGITSYSGNVYLYKCSYSGSDKITSHNHQEVYSPNTIPSDEKILNR